jgi:hypothetical protein
VLEIAVSDLISVFQNDTEELVVNKRARCLLFSRGERMIVRSGIRARTWRRARASRTRAATVLVISRSGFPSARRPYIRARAALSFRVRDKPAIDYIKAEWLLAAAIHTLAG